MFQSPILSIELRQLLQGNILLTISLLVILGMALAEGADKLHLPKITGYILAGIILGNPGLQLISKVGFQRLHVFNLVALGLMSITIGSHLDFYRLKNSIKRVLAIFLGEITLSFSLVFCALYFLLKQDCLFSLLVAAISMATAPAAVVAIIKETRSKGLLVNTLMPVVALNNITCILAFGVIVNIMIFSHGPSQQVIDLGWSLGREIVWDLFLGLGGGCGLIFFARRNVGERAKILTGVFLLVFLLTGISQHLKINSMLPCLLSGMLVTNFCIHRHQVLNVFQELEHIIFIVFFVLAGAHLDLFSLRLGGIISLAYFFARALGKINGSFIAGKLIGLPKRIYQNIGLTLLPQAGVAIGLVIMAGEVEILKDKLEFLTTLVLAVVTLNELLGPPLAQIGLKRSAEFGENRPRLIEFFREEYINLSLAGKNKPEVLESLVDFYAQTHKLTKKEQEEVLNTVLAREASGSTGFGHGIAVPHGLISSRKNISGVVGLSKQGIDFGAVDDRPVKLFVLVVTPREQKKDMHLLVLAELSKLLADSDFRQAVFNARSALEICELIKEQEDKDFNLFLES